MSGRRELVENEHPQLSLRKQCQLLSVARSTLDYEPAPERKRHRAERSRNGVRISCVALEQLDPLRPPLDLREGT